MLFLGALWVFSKLMFVYFQYLYSNVQQINLEGLNKTNNTITGSMNFIVGMKQILKLNSIKYEYSCSVAIFIVRHKIKQNQKKSKKVHSYFPSLKIGFIRYQKHNYSATMMMIFLKILFWNEMTRAENNPPSKEKSLYSQNMVKWCFHLFSKSD